MTTLIIDRDTCSMILDASELTRERVRPCIDAIARRIEKALEEAGVEGVEVEREYATTGRHSTADIDPRLIERVLVGDVDAIRAEVLLADCDVDALVEPCRIRLDRLDRLRALAWIRAIDIPFDEDEDNDEDNDEDEAESDVDDE